MSSTRIYVGNLPIDIRTREVEDIFYKYGRIRDIDVKFPSRPPAFAFVDFEDARDAEDAIRGRDGYEYDGARLRVELANGGRRESGRARDKSARYPRNIRGNGEFTVEVSNLPPRASWQDLKDFTRKVGDVMFTEVDGHGGGIVEFSNKRDMKYAVEKLDDSEFHSRGDTSIVRVRERGSSRSRSRSRSSTHRSSKKRSRSRSEGDAEREKKVKRSESVDKEPEKEKDAEDKEDGKEEATVDANDSEEVAEPETEEPKEEEEPKEAESEE
ncbi:hypothetical protein V7S43_001609 [Phytophthora oleae]|uniref:RRM domain-containing protein n=1 Tax=Phytophthora oleae TaxID=2107226 RepID=A0ABD3G476_9STRA